MKDTVHFLVNLFLSNKSPHQPFSRYKLRQVSREFCFRSGNKGWINMSVKEATILRQFRISYSLQDLTWVPRIAASISACVGYRTRPHAHFTLDPLIPTINFFRHATRVLLYSENYPWDNPIEYRRTGICGSSHFGKIQIGMLRYGACGR